MKKGKAEDEKNHLVCEQRPPCVKGERAVRCQWQMKHGERVAAVKISAA